MIGTSNLPGKRFVLWKNDPASSKRWVNQSKGSDQSSGTSSSINTAAPANLHYKKPQDSWLCGKIRGCSTSAINVSSLRNLKIFVEYNGHKKTDQLNYLRVKNRFYIEYLLVDVVHHSKRCPALVYSLLDKKPSGDQGDQVFVQFFGSKTIEKIAKTSIIPFKFNEGGRRGDYASNAAEDLLDWLRVQKTQWLLLKGPYTISPCSLYIYSSKNGKSEATLIENNTFTRTLKVMIQNEKYESIEVDPTLTEVSFTFSDEELDQMMIGIAPSSRKLMSRHPRRPSSSEKRNPLNWKPPTWMDSSTNYLEAFQILRERTKVLPVKGLPRNTRSRTSSCSSSRSGLSSPSYSIGSDKDNFDQLHSPSSPVIQRDNRVKNYLEILSNCSSPDCGIYNRRECDCESLDKEDDKFSFDDDIVHEAEEIKRKRQCHCQVDRTTDVLSDEDSKITNENSLETETERSRSRRNSSCNELESYDLKGNTRKSLVNEVDSTQSTNLVTTSRPKVSRGKSSFDKLIYISGNIRLQAPCLSERQDPSKSENFDTSQTDDRSINQYSNNDFDITSLISENSFPVILQKPNAEDDNIDDTPRTPLPGLNTQLSVTNGKSNIDNGNNFVKSNLDSQEGKNESRNKRDEIGDVSLLHSDNIPGNTNTSGANIKLNTKHDTCKSVIECSRTESFGNKSTSRSSMGSPRISKKEVKVGPVNSACETYKSNISSQLSSSDSTQVLLNEEKVSNKSAFARSAMLQNEIKLKSKMNTNDVKEIDKPESNTALSGRGISNANTIGDKFNTDKGRTKFNKENQPDKLARVFKKAGECVKCIIKADAGICCSRTNENQAKTDSLKGPNDRMTSVKEKHLQNSDVLAADKPDDSSMVPDSSMVTANKVKHPNNGLKSDSKGMSNTKCLGQTYSDRKLEKTSVSANLSAPTNVIFNQSDEDLPENKTPVIISPKEAGHNNMFGDSSKIICDISQRNSNASNKDRTEPTIVANNLLIDTNSTATLVASKSSVNMMKENQSESQTHQTGANPQDGSTIRTSQDELMGHYDIDSILRDSEKDHQGSSEPIKHDSFQSKGKENSNKIHVPSRNDRAPNEHGGQEQCLSMPDSASKTLNQLELLEINYDSQESPVKSLQNNETQNRESLERCSGIVSDIHFSSSNDSNPLPYQVNQLTEEREKGYVGQMTLKPGVSLIKEGGTILKAIEKASNVSHAINATSFTGTNNPPTKSNANTFESLSPAIAVNLSSAIAATTQRTVKAKDFVKDDFNMLQIYGEKKFENESFFPESDGVVLKSATVRDQNSILTNINLSNSNNQKSWQGKVLKLSSNPSQLSVIHNIVTEKVSAGNNSQVQLPLCHSSSYSTLTRTTEKLTTTSASLKPSQCSAIVGKPNNPLSEKILSSVSIKSFEKTSNKEVNSRRRRNEVKESSSTAHFTTYNNTQYGNTIVSAAHTYTYPKTSTMWNSMQDPVSIPYEPFQGLLGQKSVITTTVATVQMSQPVMSNAKLSDKTRNNNAASGDLYQSHLKVSNNAMQGREKSTWSDPQTVKSIESSRTSAIVSNTFSHTMQITTLTTSHNYPRQTTSNVKISKPRKGSIQGRDINPPFRRNSYPQGSNSVIPNSVDSFLMENFIQNGSQLNTIPKDARNMPAYSSTAFSIQTPYSYSSSVATTCTTNVINHPKNQSLASSKTSVTHAEQNHEIYNLGNYPAEYMQKDGMPNPHHGGDSYSEIDPQIGNIEELLSYRSVKETFLVNDYAQHQGNPIIQPENHEINSSNNRNFALNPKNIKTKTLEKSQRSKQATGEKGKKGTESKKITKPPRNTSSRKSAHKNRKQSNTVNIQTNKERFGRSRSISQQDAERDYQMFLSYISDSMENPHVLNYVTRLFEIMHSNSETLEYKAIASLQVYTHKNILDFYRVLSRVINNEHTWESDTEEALFRSQWLVTRIPLLPIDRFEDVPSISTNMKWLFIYSRIKSFIKACIEEYNCRYQWNVHSYKDNYRNVDGKLPTNKVNQYFNSTNFQESSTEPMLLEPSGYSNYSAFNNSSELVNSSRSTGASNERSTCSNNPNKKDRHITTNTSVKTKDNSTKPLKKMKTSSFQKDAHQASQQESYINPFSIDATIGLSPVDHNSFLKSYLGPDVNTEDAFDNILQSPKYKQNKIDLNFKKSRGIFSPISIPNIQATPQSTFTFASSVLQTNDQTSDNTDFSMTSATGNQTSLQNSNCPDTSLPIIDSQLTLTSSYFSKLSLSTTSTISDISEQSINQKTKNNKNLQILDKNTSHQAVHPSVKRKRIISREANERESETKEINADPENVMQLRKENQQKDEIRNFAEKIKLVHIEEQSSIPHPVVMGSMNEQTNNNKNVTEKRYEFSSPKPEKEDSALSETKIMKLQFSKDPLTQCTQANIATSASNFSEHHYNDGFSKPTIDKTSMKDVGVIKSNIDTETTEAYVRSSSFVSNESLTYINTNITKSFIEKSAQKPSIDKKENEFSVAHSLLKSPDFLRDKPNVQPFTASLEVQSRKLQAHTSKSEGVSKVKKQKTKSHTKKSPPEITYDEFFPKKFLQKTKSRVVKVKKSRIKKFIEVTDITFSNRIFKAIEVIPDAVDTPNSVDNENRFFNRTAIEDGIDVIPKAVGKDRQYAVICSPNSIKKEPIINSSAEIFSYNLAKRVTDESLGKQDTFIKKLLSSNIDAASLSIHTLMNQTEVRELSPRYCVQQNTNNFISAQVMKHSKIEVTRSRNNTLSKDHREKTQAEREMRLQLVATREQLPTGSLQITASTGTSSLSHTLKTVGKERCSSQLVTKPLESASLTSNPISEKIRATKKSPEGTSVEIEGNVATSERNDLLNPNVDIKQMLHLRATSQIISDIYGSSVINVIAKNVNQDPSKSKSPTEQRTLVTLTNSFCIANSDRLNRSKINEDFKRYKEKIISTPKEMVSQQENLVPSNFQNIPASISTTRKGSAGSIEDLINAANLVPSLSQNKENDFIINSKDEACVAEILKLHDLCKKQTKDQVQKNLITTDSRKKKQRSSSSVMQDFESNILDPRRSKSSFSINEILSGKNTSLISVQTTRPKSTPTFSVYTVHAVSSSSKTPNSCTINLVNTYPYGSGQKNKSAENLTSPLNTPLGSNANSPLGIPLSATFLQYNQGNSSTYNQSSPSFFDSNNSASEEVNTTQNISIASMLNTQRKETSSSSNPSVFSNHINEVQANVEIGQSGTTDTDSLTGNPVASNVVTGEIFESADFLRTNFLPNPSASSHYTLTKNQSLESKNNLKAEQLKNPVKRRRKSLHNHDGNSTSSDSEEVTLTPGKKRRSSRKSFSDTQMKIKYCQEEDSISDNNLQESSSDEISKSEYPKLKIPDISGGNFTSGYTQKMHEKVKSGISKEIFDTPVLSAKTNIVSPKSAENEAVASSQQNVTSPQLTKKSKVMVEKLNVAAGTNCVVIPIGHLPNSQEIVTALKNKIAAGASGIQLKIPNSSGVYVPTYVPLTNIKLDVHSSNRFSVIKSLQERASIMSAASKQAVRNTSQSSLTQTKDKSSRLTLPVLSEHPSTKAGTQTSPFKVLVKDIAKGKKEPSKSQKNSSGESSVKKNHTGISVKSSIKATKLKSGEHKPNLKTNQQIAAAAILKKEKKSKKRKKFWYPNENEDRSFDRKVKNAKRALYDGTKEEDDLTTTNKTSLRGKYFLQDSSCIDLTHLPKCIDCQEENLQESRSNFAYCRFTMFRRLYQTEKGKIKAAGFCSPESADENDLKHWLFQDDVQLDLGICKAILRDIGMQFRQVVNQEIEAQKWGGKKDQIAWKRPVLLVREMCDICATTIFNTHWTCDKCGFGVCLDCFRAARDFDLGRSCGSGTLVENGLMEPSNLIEKSKRYEWPECDEDIPHETSELIVTQSIPKNVLTDLLQDMLVVCQKIGLKFKKPDLLEFSHHKNEEFMNFDEDETDLVDVQSDETETKSPHLSTSNPRNIFESYEELELPPFPSPECRWLCEGNMLHITQAKLSDDAMKWFQSEWNKGKPIIVANVHHYMKREIWTPVAFYKDFGHEENDIVNCLDGSTKEKFSVGQFWRGFQNVAERPVFDDEPVALLKLKDWPPGDDFKDKMPERFADIMQALPASTYTHRDGELNLASRLPSFFAVPDLGPKMYNAYGSASYPKAGTTNLHLDISDATNVIAYVGIPNDEVVGPKEVEDTFQIVDRACCEATKERIRQPNVLPGALWHIFPAHSADKIRCFLRRIAEERGMEMKENSDPIHDQSFYLNQDLLDRLYKEERVKGYAICQCLGDAVFIPAGAPHQVLNLHSCIKVAEDFVAPEHITHCFQLTQEFRHLSDFHTNHEDKLQIKNIIFHSVKDCLGVVMKNYGL